MRRNFNINDLLKPLSETESQAYLSDKLQVADVIDWVLSQTGEADIIQTTFSVAEEYLRHMSVIKAKGLVRNLKILIDFKATNKTVNLWLFMSNVANELKLVQNHSKLILFRPTNGVGKNVAMITSQNLTRGNRFESALITTNQDVFNTLMSQIGDLELNAIDLYEFIARAN